MVPTWKEVPTDPPLHLKPIIGDRRLLFADVLRAASALEAVSAGNRPVQENPISRMHKGHALPSGVHNAGSLVAYDHSSLPGHRIEVRGTYTCLDFNQNFARRRVSRSGLL
jgi:hypothetical protein